MRAGSDFNLNGLKLIAPVLDPLGAAPVTLLNVGRMYYDTAVGAPRYYNGASWDLKATDSTLHGGQTLAQVLARSAHTGQQTASTISDFDTQVRTSRLDQLAVPTASLNVNSQRIINVAAPTSDTDAATRGYVISQVQANAAGIDSKPSVRIALTANDTLSGTAARDGVAPVAGDRVLAPFQTTATQNGVYIVAAGAWTRAVDADETGEITPGALWFVEEGTANGGSQFRVQNTGTITLGSTAISIVKFGAAQVYTASNGVLLTGSNFTIQVQASGGFLAEASGLKVDRTLVPYRAAGLIGDGASFSPFFDHNLNTKDVVVTVRDAATDEMVLVHWVATTVNRITFTFNTPVAPAANTYRVSVIG